MRPTRSIPLVLLLLLLCVCFTSTLTGCVNAPKGTVEYGDGLALDLDENGQADTDANGEPIILNEKLYKIAGKADSFAPGALTAAGGIANTWLPGVGVVLAGVGYLWKKHKFGRIFANTVTATQAIRRKFKDNPDVLATIDETLKIAQIPETIEMVRDIKSKLKVPSVTGSKPVAT